jgi:hypothetical protein
MSGTDGATTAEQQRLAAVPSLVTIAAPNVNKLVELRADYLPESLRQLGAPAGWRRVDLTASPAAPARMIVSGPHTDGSWDGCDTIRAFSFAGALPAEVLHNNADCTLRGLAAEQITAEMLAAPTAPAAIAVRSRGHFIAAGRRYWAQFSTYLANPTPTARGLLLEHSVITDAGCHAALRDDITQLSNAVHHAFLTIVEHAPGVVGASEDNQAMTRADQEEHSHPGFRHFRYDATGLQGKRMRLTDDLPTSDAGRPQEALIGVTDVICLDDTPSVLLNLRVHPVGHPDTTGLVEYDQLALYDDQ